MKFLFAVILLVGVVGFTLATPSRKFFHRQETTDSDTPRTNKDLAHNQDGAVSKRLFCNWQCTTKCTESMCCNGFFIAQKSCKKCNRCRRYCTCNQDWSWP